MSWWPRAAKVALACVLLLLAVVGITGPGKFLPQYAEGRLLLSLSPTHGLTELDVLAFELVAVAGYLLWSGLRPRRASESQPSEGESQPHHRHPPEVEVEGDHARLGGERQPRGDQEERYQRPHSPQ